jgi:hypothetical protein
MSELASAAQDIVVPITVALITAGSSIFAVIRSNKKASSRMRSEAEAFRIENTQQHNDNKAVAEESKTLLSHLSNQVSGIDSKVDRLDERLDNVQIWQSEHEKVHLTEKESTDLDI